jgi:hypothetical protein
MPADAGVKLAPLPLAAHLRKTNVAAKAASTGDVNAGRNIFASQPATTPNQQENQFFLMLEETIAFFAVEWESI